jgi:uncharacterized protein (TIGR02001 family)
MSQPWSLGRVSAGVLIGASVALAAISPANAADPAAPKEMPAAAAATSTLIDFAFGARVQSDYNFRGISQSDHSWSPQAYAEVQVWDNFFYAGVAGYRVDLATRPDAEIDLTAGIRPKWGPLTFDFGVIRYWYPGERQFFDPYTGGVLTPRNTDMTEVAAKVAWAFDPNWTFGAGIFHAWDWLGSGAPGTYHNATIKYTFTDTLPGFAISGELGYYSLGTVDTYLGGFKLADYTYWNAGVSYTWKNLTLDLRYHDTDLSKDECFINTTDPQGVFSGSLRSNWCQAAFVATLSVDFVASQLGIFAPR